jgi:1,4-dihydroxy-2-naphthoate octaprenyltransferase
MSGLKYANIFGPMRLPFLILNPACVALGAATANFSGRSINPWHLILVLIGAICAHISVNALNEYDDFKSGLDFKTQRTPFSGGSGTLPQNPDMARYALVTGMISLVIAALIGIYFLWIVGAGLLPFGLSGLLLLVAYTKWLTKSPLLCLIAPGLGFGPCMVMGTHFALAGVYSWTAVMASLVPFCLVSDLLLLNQFPDIEADQSIGRRHLPIVIGRLGSVVVYTALLIGAYAAVLVGYLTGVFPFQSLLALATLLLALPIIGGIFRYSGDIPKLLPYMGMNVVINIATPVFLAVGLFLGR